MRPKNALSLLLASFIWGMAFVAQRVGMDYVGPFTFNGTRSLLGAVVLIPLILALGRRNRKGEEEHTPEPGGGKTLLLAGVVCGVLLFAASSLQQIGLQYVSAGKSGFITSFYIVFVPLLGIFLKKKIGWKVWVAVAVAFVGLYFLCIADTFSLGRGDVLTFLCAIAFALQILAVDYFAPRVDVVRLSCIQLLVCGILSVPFMFALETPTLSGLRGALVPILYAGILSCGVAYTLQIVGQRNVNPAIASLLMSLEACFSVLGGWVILGERLSAREGLGCVLLFAAVVLAELPGREKHAQTP